MLYDSTNEIYTVKQIHTWGRLIHSSLLTGAATYHSSIVKRLEIESR